MKNLHQFLVILLSLCTSFSVAQNQNNQLETIYQPDNNIDFSNKNDLLPTSDFQSFLVVGVADIDGDCLDDIIRLEDGEKLNIEYQRSNNLFENFEYGDIDSNPQWNIAVADVDQNGFKDILIGGLMDGMKLLLADDSGTYYSQSELPNSDIFSQGTNFSDINNDGHVDIFVCNDMGESRIWRNAGNGNFLPADDWIDMSTVPESDKSGNYSSLWTDFDNDGDLDLYISKCKNGVTDPTSPLVVNQLFIQEDSILFSEQAANHGLNVGAQSWTSDFQDIDNDGDLDCFIVNHDSICQLFENDGNGLFTEITMESGLNITTNHLQGLMRDFDNDGFVDILVAGNYGYEYYENQGDATFIKINDVFGTYLMSTFAVGDLNHDGFLDLYSASSVAGADDILWFNEHSGNNNHFFAVNLIGESSNINAIGARLELYGPWGVQLREVRSGESYGIMNSFTQIFGLGSANSIDSLVVKWPSGLKEVFESPFIDQFLQIVENDCAYPGKFINSNGITKVCSGDSLALIAPAGDAFIWSNGEITQEIQISEGGTYSVTVTNGNDCSTISNPINIIQDPDETPTISSPDATTFCLGGAIKLYSSEAESYLWSNGETTQSILVFQSGVYTVAVPGFCQDFTSDPFEVTVVDVPDDPEVLNDTITNSGTVTLIAEGENVNWFYSCSDTIPFFEGSIYETTIDETTVFYVQAENEINGVVCQSECVEVYGVIITAVSNIESIENIEVYPNPANQKIVIDFKNGMPSTMELQLNDLHGRLIFSKSIVGQNAPFKESVSLLTVPPGFYNLSIVSDEQVYVQKLVIQKE